MSILLCEPLLMAVIVSFAGRLLRPSISRSLTLAALGFEWLCFVLILGGVLPASAQIMGLALHIDGLSLPFIALTLGLLPLVLIYSAAEARGQHGEEKYYALMLILTAAVLGTACATDLLNLWLWFELMVTSTYFLVAFHRDHPATLEAAVKYLVQSALGSTLVLFGIALMLAQSGTLALEQPNGSASFEVAAVLLVIGFGVKLAIVPLHTWLPDTYSQAPEGISALLAGVVTTTGVIPLLRVLTPLSSFAGLLLLFGLVNMIVGNLLALRQRNLKRLLAYSSLPHIGYMLFGIGIGLFTGTTDGIRGGLFQMLNHGLMKGLAFLAAGVLLNALHRQSGIDRPLRIDDLNGAARRVPLASLALVLALLSLAGIPPLAGFMSKWQILAAGMASGSPLLIFLTFIAALNTLFSLAYYLPVVNALFQSGESVQVRMPVAEQLPLLVLSTALVVIGIAPDALNWLTQPASLVLLQSLAN